MENEWSERMKSDIIFFKAYKMGHSQMMNAWIKEMKKALLSVHRLHKIAKKNIAYGTELG